MSTPSPAKSHGSHLQAGLDRTPDPAASSTGASTARSSVVAVSQFSPGAHILIEWTFPGEVTPRWTDAEVLEERPSPLGVNVFLRIWVAAPGQTSQPYDIPVWVNLNDHRWINPPTKSTNECPLPKPLPIGTRLSLRWPKDDKDVEQMNSWTMYKEKDSNRGNYVWIDATITDVRPTMKRRYMLKFSDTPKDTRAANLAGCARPSNLNDTAFVCHDFIPTFWTPVEQLGPGQDIFSQAKKEGKELEKEYPLHVLTDANGEPFADINGNPLPGRVLSGKQKKKLKMYERMREQGKEMEFKVAPEKQQKIWSALIGKCMKETPQDLLKAVRSHIKGFDLSNTANIMHRACKVLTLGLPKSWLATQPPQEANELNAKAKDDALIIMMMACAKFSKLDLGKLENCIPEELGMCAWALGKSRTARKVPKTFRFIVQRLREYLVAYTNRVEQQAVTTALHGLVTDGTCEDVGLYSTLSSFAFTTKMENWKSQEVSNLCWCLAKTDMFCPSMVDIIIEQVVPVLEFPNTQSWYDNASKYHSREISAVCWSMARGVPGYREEVGKFFRRVSSVIKRDLKDHLAGWTDLDTCNFIWAFAEIGVRDRDLMRIVCESLVPLMPKMAPNQYGSLTYAMGKLHFYHIDVMDGICKIGKNMAGRCEFSTVVSVLIGCSKIGIGRNADFLPWVDQALVVMEQSCRSKHSRQASKAGWAILAWSIAVCIATGWGVTDAEPNVGLSADMHFLQRCTHVVVDCWHNLQHELDQVELCQFYTLQLVLQAVDAPGAERLPTPETNANVAKAKAAMQFSAYRMSQQHLLGKTTNFEKRIADALKNIGRSDFQEEAFVDDVYVDILLPAWSEGQVGVIVEADGPRHYVDDVTKPNSHWSSVDPHNGYCPSASDQKALADMRCTFVDGPTLMKSKMLRAKGYDVINVPWWDFELDVEGNKEYMSARLNTIVDEAKMAPRGSPRAKRSHWETSDHDTKRRKMMERVMAHTPPRPKEEIKSEGVKSEAE